MIELFSEVAPFVGAWIEMSISTAPYHFFLQSLPSWERGLKSSPTCEELKPIPVAPFVGAWIEMY